MIRIIKHNRFAKRHHIRTVRLTIRKSLQQQQHVNTKNLLKYVVIYATAIISRSDFAQIVLTLKVTTVIKFKFSQTI